MKNFNLTRSMPHRSRAHAFAQIARSAFVALLLVGLLGGCDGHPIGGPLPPTDDTTVDGNGDLENPAAEDEASTTCCEPDPSPSGCMQMGGPARAGGCFETCDFYCATNWRLTKRDGCEEWTYSTRAPGPDEDENCFPIE